MVSGRGSPKAHGNPVAEKLDALKNLASKDVHAV